MRAFFYALVAVVLLALCAGVGWLWRDSASTTTQVLVRSGGPRAGLITVDRGAAALLISRGAPLGAETRLIRGVADPGVRLDEACDKRALGFGVDSLVRQSGLLDVEAQAMLTVHDTPAWRGRRVVLPMWAVLAGVAGVLLVWWLRFNLPLYRELRGRCRRCAYDIRNSSHFCPVCKQALPRRTWSGDARPGGAR